jgi:predicted ATPase/signal transduction histidine kinase
MPSIQAGSVKYHISEEIYKGSRTLVCRGYRETDQMPVVIKLLKNVYPSFSELVQFRNQYTIAKNLNLPGIIQTYSLEPYQNGYALVMEDFGGISLKAWMGGNPLDLREFLQIAIALSDILNLLYRQRIIHKDIKPTNILINPETKQVKLIDFSIASLLSRETQILINPNVLEGTLGYLSPEQTGRMNRGIDYRTDFYSLGVTFYELLTGQLPFPSDDALELVHCHIAKQPPLVHEINPQIPPVLSLIVSKLMAKNSEERYQSALGLKFDLENCLHQLQENGVIKDFQIAERDVCDRFIIPEKLYGREAEVKTLLAAFERVAQNQTELMLIAGFSGIGKTAIVNEVHKPIVRQRGYFIKGKFDQFNRNIPFLAFVQAFRDLMGQLLSENDAQLADWRDKILQALGENGQVIIEVIPELERIIGQQPPAIELSGTAAQNRFNLLFQKFINIFTTPEHPLVIFLDDLQWADSESFKLIQLLMKESKHGYLLLIGAYRDNEVSAAHSLMLTLEEIRKEKAIINTIVLNPLSQESLNQLVADTLNCSLTIALPLTQLIYHKTKGNPFFSTQFLKALYEDGLIQFDLDQRNWQCDIATIKVLALTNDVVEFMALQLQKLPIVTQNVLKLAACIGNQFDLKTLAIVSQKPEVETAAHLWKALQGGFILPQNEIYKFYIERETAELEQNSEIVTYKFLHDRVQQAAYSLIPNDQKQNTHYHIGQLLLEQIPLESKEDRIFELVNQLNYGMAVLSQQTEKDQLAQLNFIACRKARAATAYQVARTYSIIGLSLLGEQGWQQKYEMTLALHELAAEIASLCGDFAQMEQLINTVIEQAHSLLEQVNVHRIRIQAYASQNKLANAVAIGQQFLQQLGVIFPENSTQTDIQTAIQEINELINNREIADLVYLPIMMDREKLAIVQIANSILPAAFNCGSPLFPLLICLSVKLSIQYGNTSISAYSYACYGIILSSIFTDVDTATKFGQLALCIVSKLDAKAVKAEVLPVLGLFILHRQSHIRDTLPISQEGYTTGLEVGNLEFAGYSAYNFCLNSFWCGQTLVNLEQDTRNYCNALVYLNQSTTANYCRIYWQSILNLLNLAEHPVILSGQALQETEFLPLLLANNDLIGLCFFYLYKLVLCFLFAEIEEAQNNAIEARKYFMLARGMFVEPIFYFYDSLVALANLEQNSDQQLKALERVAQNQKQLQEYWVLHAPMNHQHKFYLVEAEKYRVLGKNYEAGDLYDRAISGAKKNEYIQEEALSNELAAKFYLNWGKEKIAAGYMQEAYYCYVRWGAKAKTEDLEQRYPQLLFPILQTQQSHFLFSESLNFDIDPFSVPHQTIQTSHIRSSSNTSDFLDFAAILKTSQVLSSQIQLEQLLSILVQVVMENAGADKCSLILLRDENLVIEAMAVIGNENTAPQTIVLQSIPLELSQDLPISLIKYVSRTQEVLVINDASIQNSFAPDVYIQKQQPKSLLCTPVINQGKLIGIVYLENNLTTGVFTSDRLQILNLLTSQAAISLENAKLYETLEQKVEERTQELQEKTTLLEDTLQKLYLTQAQLIQTEKMSSLENIVAGIAHTINNPISFIYGNITYVDQYVETLLELINLYQEIYPQPRPEIQAKIAEIDLEFVVTDLQNLLKSMWKGSDRIRETVKSLRNFSRLDEAALKPVDIHSGIDSTLLILQHRLNADDEYEEIQVIKEYGELPLVNCYASQLNQVFIKIFNNAIDALQRAQKYPAEWNKKPTIIIKTAINDSQNVVISIADNGLGIKESLLNKIFEPLSTTSSGGKSGNLGLSICYLIVVEKHQGKLSCNSTPGEGTEFIIEIPIS